MTDVHTECVAFLKSTLEQIGKPGYKVTRLSCGSMTPMLGGEAHTKLKVAARWAAERDGASLRQMPSFEADTWVLGDLHLHVWMCYVDDIDETLYWVTRPSRLEYEFVEPDRRFFGAIISRRLHSLSGAAFVHDLGCHWFIHGVEVKQHVVEAPEAISLQEIQAERNEEVRRVMIERWPGGWKRFLLESKVPLLETRFNERDQQTEELYLGRFIVRDPSTGRRYALGVPRTVQTCQEAQDWLSHGLDSRAVHRS